jgi:soluble lytic murein transglycosylase-like protein
MGYQRKMRLDFTSTARKIALGTTVFGCVISAWPISLRAADTYPESIDEQIAFSSTRVGFLNLSAAPRPLVPSEAALARRVIALHARGAWAEAAAEIEGGLPDWLRGALLADRYLDPRARVSEVEAAAWLDRYGASPEAPAIRKLAASLGPATIVVRAKQAAKESPRALFLRGRDAQAAAAGLALADAPGALTPSRGDGILAAGLAAWRAGRPKDAAELFAALHAGAVSPEQRAAGAFWAARAAERAGDANGRMAWLASAARDRDTFYGRIAERALGERRDCHPAARAALAASDLDAVGAETRGMRMFAWLQLGERGRAEAELRVLRMEGRQDPRLLASASLVARDAGLRLASAAAPRAVPVLRAPGGFTVDPALVHGIVQHESRFDARAHGGGARGLMQIRPATAIGIGAIAPGQADLLYDPAVNLRAGQQYLALLADDPAIKGDLIRVLAAYAQGQGAFRKWAPRLAAETDPLLFAESIPNGTVRHLIQHALSHAWAHAAATGLPADSLDALAEGRFPALLRGKALPERGPAAAECEPRVIPTAASTRSPRR